MRKLLFGLLLSAFLSGGLTISSFVTPHVYAASHHTFTTSSIARSAYQCDPADYGCGYVDGFQAAKIDVSQGTCLGNTIQSPQQAINTITAPPIPYQKSASDQGYADAHSHFCNT